MTQRVRPPTMDEVHAIQSESRRMGLKLTMDEIRKVIYAVDIVYDKAARAALAKEDKPKIITMPKSIEGVFPETKDKP